MLLEVRLKAVLAIKSAKLSHKDLMYVWRFKADPNWGPLDGSVN